MAGKLTFARPMRAVWDANEFALPADADYALFLRDLETAVAAVAKNHGATRLGGGTVDRVVPARENFLDWLDHLGGHTD